MKTIFLLMGVFSSLFTVLVSANTAHKVINDSKAANEKSITIVLNVLPSVRTAFVPIFKQFETETGIKVIPQKFVEDFDFEEQMDRWLIKGENTPDVLYGHNNMRLQKMAEYGVVHPITHLWKKNQWDLVFRPEFVDGVSYADEQYGLPYAVYTWGLFYKRSLTYKIGPVPTTWKEFKAYCRKLKAMGIAPFPASEKQPYIAAAWFEYLILRMHGLELFNQVLSGQVSFHNSAIQEVLIEWKELIDEGFFDTFYYKMRWQQYLPYFLRDKIGFVLMGTPLASRIFDQNVRDEVEFMEFPKIKSIDKYETAPSNVFFIAANSKKISYSEQFLEFISQTEIQTKLSTSLHTSPARIDAITGNDKYAQQGIASINSADGLSPFFDRGAEPKFERLAVKSFAKFLKTADVKQLTDELESARFLSYYNDSYSFQITTDIKAL
jgi:multiple sugar transport system substrate-binding protein